MAESVARESGVEAYARQTRVMAERYGYRPSPARVCPRTVVGKHCRETGRLEGLPCECRRFMALFDHGRVWITKAGGHALTGEPYGLDDKRELLEACRGELAGLGLQMEVSADSPWYPGHTMLIHVTRKNTKENDTLPPHG